LWRMETLRKIPARTRYVIAEPILEDLMPDIEQHIEGFDQLMVGGESGNGTTSGLWTSSGPGIFAICARPTTLRSISSSMPGDIRNSARRWTVSSTRNFPQPGIRISLLTCPLGRSVNFRCWI